MRIEFGPNVDVDGYNRMFAGLEPVVEGGSPAYIEVTTRAEEEYAGYYQGWESNEYGVYLRVSRPHSMTQRYNPDGTYFLIHEERIDTITYP